MTLQERLKEGKEGRERGERAVRPATPEITLMIEMRRPREGEGAKTGTAPHDAALRRRPREKEENNNPIRRDSLSSRQISGRTADGHTGRAGTE